jgi:hypothetical protein
MTRYLISFDAHAMDHIPAEDMPAVAKAAHAVVQEILNAGVLVFTGGLENQRASIVATDGTVRDRDCLLPNGTVVSASGVCVVRVTTATAGEHGKVSGAGQGQT